MSNPHRAAKRKTARAKAAAFDADLMTRTAAPPEAAPVCPETIPLFTFELTPKHAEAIEQHADMEYATRQAYAEGGDDAVDELHHQWETETYTNNAEPSDNSEPWRSDNPRPRSWCSLCGQPFAACYCNEDDDPEADPEAEPIATSESCAGAEPACHFCGRIGCTESNH